MGGKFEVDLNLSTDLSRAIDSDHIEDTINYVEIYQLVKKIVTESRFHLLEALAGKIIKEIFENYRLNEITIKVRKPGVPLHGVVDTVEVEITRNRKDME